MDKNNAVIPGKITLAVFFMMPPADLKKLVLKKAKAEIFRVLFFMLTLTTCTVNC